MSAGNAANGATPGVSVAILAGGVATRIRPLTETFPKALIAVHGRPFIEYQLALLRGQGFSDIVLCVGYEGLQIEAHVGDGARFGVRVRYSYDGKELVGTGGALRQALHMLSDPFVVTYGDAYLRGDYGAFLRSFQEQKMRRTPPPLGLMTVFRNEDQFDISNVVFRDGAIVVYDKIQRTPEMRYIDWGVGILDHVAFELAPPSARFDLGSLYGALVARGQLAGFEVRERFYEIGSHEGLESFRRNAPSLG